MSYLESKLAVPRCGGENETWETDCDLYEYTEVEFDPRLSVFTTARSANPAGDLPLSEFAEGIRGGLWAEPVAAARASVGTDRYAETKKELPAVTPAGTFTQRGSAGLNVHSGFVVLDFDGLSTEREAAALRDRADTSPHVALAFISPSARGVKVFVRIERDDRRAFDAESHKRLGWEAAAQHLHKIIDGPGVVDPSGKDVARLCFVSHDPDARYTPDVQPLIVSTQVEHEPARPALPLGAGSADDEWGRIEEAIFQIPPDVGYDEWVRAGMALRSTGDPRGRELYERWSSGGEKYRQGEPGRKYDSFSADGGVTIATLFAMARDAGGDSADIDRRDQRARVQVRDEDLLVLLDEAWDVVGRYNAECPRVFRYAGGVATVGTTENGDPMIRPLRVDAMRERLAEAAIWYRREMIKTKTGMRDEEHETKPPADLARIMLATPRDDMPALLRIVRAPIASPSGAIITSEGYCHETGTYYASGGLVVPEIADAPSGDEIRAARDLILEDLLGDFPFVGEADRTNTLALFLTPFAREIIGHHPTPLHLIEKPTPGTGASLMVDALVAVVSGTETVALTEARDEDEWRKRITAVLLQSPDVVSLDNLNDLNSAALSSALTARTWSDRRLGASETVHIPVRCTWAGTGNNPSVSSEIARRVVSIRLDTKTEQPWTRAPREFRHPNLLGWVRDNRGQLIHALLTLIRAWQAEGSKPGCAVLGSYERWAGVISGILDTSAVEGFMANRERFYSRADEESAAWHTFIEAWWSQFDSRVIGARELWTLIEPPNGVSPSVEPPCDLGSGNSRSQRSRLGQALRRAADRRFSVAGGRLKIESTGTRQGAAQYRLVALSATDDTPTG